MAKLTWNPPEITYTKATYRWDADHAARSWFGFKRQDGTTAPARPWTDHAIAGTNIPADMKRNFNGDIGAAFAQTAHQLGDKFKDSIQDPIWDWDRTTKRKSGQVVTTPRDIVDTGELLRSQSMELS